MRIAVFGLGYVGSVSSGCLASAGHQVVGVDVDPQKVELLRLGRSPVTEPDLDALLANVISTGALRVTADTAEAVRSSDLSLICVGTPSQHNGRLDTSFLARVVEQIGRALAGQTAYHVVAVRSTLLPGVLESTLMPLLEAASGRRIGADIGLCVNPEFLREGSAIRDFGHPPFTVIGETDRRAGDVLLEAYAHLAAPVHRMQPGDASMVKYVCNAFHALKVAFANEVGALSHDLGIDGRRVMEVFCEDRELNISRRYLRPGFAFGGSCLPKDLRALNYVAKVCDVSTPLLGSVIASNEAAIGRVVDTVLASGKRRVALLGLSFKDGTDDLRESPFVAVAEALIGKGLRLRVFDPDVALGQLIGRNRAFIEDRLPHIAQLMDDRWEPMVHEAEVVIVAKRVAHPERLSQVIGSDQMVIDLVGFEALRTAVRPWAAAAAEMPVAASAGF